MEWVELPWQHLNTQLHKLHPQLRTDTNNVQADPGKLALTVHPSLYPVW